MTRYQQYNVISNLIEHLNLVKVFESSIHIPKSLGKKAKQSENRLKTPYLSSQNISDLNNEHGIHVDKWIKSFHDEINSNLATILTIAKEYIRQCNNIYKEKELVETTSNSNSIFKLDHGLLANGLTQDLIAAMHIVIIEEMGINPYPLYGLQVDPHGTNSEYIKIDPDGTIRVNAKKWRQRMLQRRTKQNTEKDKNLINATFCFNYAIEASKNQRETLDTNYLWVYTSSRGINFVKAYDSHFRAFAKKYFPNKILACSPTLMKIRITKGLSLFIEDDGNPLSAATYFGNQIQTTLNTYIPMFFQEIIFRKKISNMQYTILILATSSENDKANLCGMTEKSYLKSVKNTFTNPYFGGPLYTELIKQPESQRQETFFICSIENFIFALREIKNFDGSKLSYICQDAITQARKGNLLLKSMVRDAEKELNINDV